MTHFQDANLVNKVAHAIMLRCITDDLSGDPIPNHAAYALAEAAIEIMLAELTKDAIVDVIALSIEQADEHKISIAGKSTYIIHSVIDKLMSN